jgi:catechol 2,3-dioxygenase-like lactoylglutathione lyase family enzyme
VTQPRQVTKQGAPVAGQDDERLAMRLNHINLQVSDVDAAREFFERFFGMRCRYQRQTQIAIFESDTGFEFAVSNLFNSPPPSYPPEFHVGFVLERTKDVRDIYERLKAAGVAMKVDLGIQGPALVFQCLGPDAILVEVRAPKDT